jgi:hypothetical protein
MTMLSDAIHPPRAPLTAMPIRVAATVSLLAHILLIWGWLPRLSLPSFELPGLRDTDGRLTVRLAPPPAPPPASKPAPPPAPPPSPALRARPRPAPPVIALERPATAAPAPRAAAPVPAPAARPPTGGDLLAYVEARRNARVDSVPSQGSAPATPAAEDENTRASRLAAANLATQRQITFGYDPAKSGGVFQIERLTFDYAEFTFVGWNQDVRRRTKQTIEVRTEGGGDIRRAVVRKMIAIIREHEPVEFLWDSQRLGRSVTLSSRLADNAGLEDFMLQEFF